MKWYLQILEHHLRLSNRLWCHIYSKGYYGPPRDVYVGESNVPTLLTGAK